MTIDIRDLDIINRSSILKKCGQSELSNIVAFIFPEKDFIITDNAFEGFTSLWYTPNIQNVKMIGDFAFKDTALTTLYIPNCLYIGQSAFENCNKLMSMTLLNKGDICINNNSFSNCSSLFYIENLDNISKIDDYSFSNCYNFPNTLYMPKCKSIGSYSFLNCYKLSALVANNCSFVNYNAFCGTPLFDSKPLNSTIYE